MLKLYAVPIGTALLILFGPHHARAGDIDESTKKYCIEYDKQTVTVTGIVLVRKIKYDVPEDAPPEGRGGSITFPILILDQPMCAYGDHDDQEGSVWALQLLDVDDCYLRRWSSTPVRVTGTIYHGGANITGVNLMTGETGSKRLGLLRELVPKAATIAVLINPRSPGLENHLPDVQSAARSLDLQIRVLNVTDQGEIDAAFANLARDRPDALLVNPDPFLSSRREQIVTLANHYKLPAIGEWREFAEAGGLMSYGPNHTEPYRLIGIYTGRILNGAKPAELPVIQSTKFELVINLKTAKALGLTIPNTVLIAADEVIE
jgi:hypothetical protein